MSHIFIFSCCYEYKCVKIYCAAFEMVDFVFMEAIKRAAHFENFEQNFLKLTTFKSSLQLN